LDKDTPSGVGKSFSAGARRRLRGVREAIEQREFDLVDEQMMRVADAIDRVQEALAQASRVLGRPIT
jgi:hypothetical protein